MSGSLGKKGFFSRAIALYVPWPEVAGKSFDRDAIYEGVNSIGKALEKICGASFNHFDNVDCESFRTQMAEFIKTCTKQKPDEAIVYICTHGIKHPVTEELYLMMADSKNPKDPQFYKSSISRNDLCQYIQQLEQAIPHGKVLVLLDCCHSGALFPDSAETLGYTDVRHSQARKVVHGGRGRAVFMSCRSNESSYITNNCPRFTKAVGETLMEFPKDQAIDLSKLIPVVKEKVKAWSSISQPQHPWEEPPCWSQQGKEFGNVGLGAAESDEAMDIDQEHECGPEIFLGSRTIKKWIPDDASPEKVKEYFLQIRDTVRKLEISMKEANAPQSIKDLIKKAQADWSKFSFEGVTRVVICGGTGHGKSTLINALVGDEVLPAGEEGGACTSAVIEVESNTTDDLFKAKVHFLNQAEWKELLSSWVHFEGEDNRVQKVDDDATDILKALFSGSIPESLDDMINHENVREQISQGTVDITEEDIDDFVEKLENYVLQCERGSNLFPIVKKVTVFVPSSTLRQDIVLVDIPGYCDNSRPRKAIADKQFKEGDIVWIVADAPRAVPNEIARGLVAELLKGSISRSCNLAYICTQNDKISKPKDYVRHFKEDELDPSKKESQEEIKRLLQEQKKEKKASKRQVLEKKLKVQCSYWRRHNLRVELQKATQDMFEKEKLRKQDIGVFTVSALDHLLLLKNDSPNLFTEEKDTGILELQGYAHKAVDKHRCFKVEEAYQDLLRLSLKLKTKVQSKAQDEQQWEESLEALLLEVNKVINQLNEAIDKNVTAVVAVTKERTESYSTKGCKGKIVPSGSCVAYEVDLSTMKETNWRAISPLSNFLCDRSMYGDTDFMQLTVECVVRDWDREFASIMEKLRRFEGEWMSKRGVAQAFEKLRQMNPEVMPCVALFGGKMRSVRLALEAVFEEASRNATWNVRDEAEQLYVELFRPIYRRSISADEFYDRFEIDDLRHAHRCCKRHSLVSEVDEITKKEILDAVEKKVAAAVQKSLLSSLESVKKKIEGELDDFIKEIKETLTTKLEGLEDTPLKTKKKLVEVVDTFESDVKTLQSDEC